MDPGNPVEVRCNVDATPLNNSTLTWKRDNFKFGEHIFLSGFRGNKQVVDFTLFSFCWCQLVLFYPEKDVKCFNNL